MGQISQKTAIQLFEALVEASSLFDNYPELFEMIGTYQVVTEAIIATNNEIMLDNSKKVSYNTCINCNTPKFFNNP